MNLNLCLDERPASFDAMVGQEAVVSNLRRQSQTGQFFQCYILEGQFGSGKTTMARILSKAANCEHPDEKGNPCGCCPSCRAVAAGSSDIVELDAASNTGVDSIRQIKESVSYLPVELKKKVYIIDEVHKLSDSAFNALLKVLEEPPKHVMFILCTTEMKKIPATIRSRAACYHFAQISEEKMAHKLIELSEKYRLNYDPAGIDLICMNAAGSMRNALKLLEQSSQAENGISEASVREMLGLTDPVDLFATLDSLIHGSIARTIPFVRTLLKKGCYPLSMVSDMLSICSDAVVYASTQEMEKKNTAHYRELLGDMCVDVKTSRLCEITNGLMDIYQKLQINADETTLVCGLIAMGGTESARVAKLEERIFQLEQEMKEIRVKGIARHEEAGTPITKNAEISTTETSEKTEPEDTKIIDENPIEQLNSVSEEETPTESMMDTEANTEFGERVEEETTDSLKETKSSPIDAFDLLGLFGFSHAPQKEEEKKTMEASKEIALESGNNIQETKSDVANEQQNPLALQMERKIETETENIERGVVEQVGGDENIVIPSFQAASVEDISVFEKSQDKMDDASDDEFKEKEDTYLPANTSGDVNEFLTQFYEEYPFMESVIDLGFERKRTGENNYEYVTHYDPLYRIAKSYREVVGFPFGIRKEA